MSSTGDHLFYRDASNQNAVEVIRALFEGLDNMDEVYAEYEVDEEGMVSLHNHMNSSSIWKSVSQWDSGIRYTVNHPVGKVYIFDKNRGENTCIYRETPLKKFRGKKSGEGVEFFMIKKRKIPIDFSRESCHSSNYTWVRIESKKTFKYESNRSSWDFHLSVVWEGESRESLRSSEKKKYVVQISMGSMDKASRDPGYTTASFVEKLMDTLFQNSRGRYVTFDPSYLT